jgi:hypothetical protein
MHCGIGALGPEDELPQARLIVIYIVVIGSMFWSCKSGERSSMEPKNRI